jgi:hypothetical protein
MSRVNHGVTEIEIGDAEYTLRASHEFHSYMDRVFDGIVGGFAPLSEIKTDVMSKILSVACSREVPASEFRQMMISDLGHVDVEINGTSYRLDASYQNITKLEKKYGGVKPLLSTMAKGSLSATRQLVADLCGEKVSRLKTLENDIRENGLIPTNEVVGEVIADAFSPTIPVVEPLGEFLIAAMKGGAADAPEPDDSEGNE